MKTHTPYVTIIVLLLAACGRPGHSEPTSVSLADELRTMRAARLAATPSDWPSRTDCDATLWAGLASAAGVSLDLGEAVAADGSLHRRPLTSGECYPLESASTVSNDMILGFLAGATDAQVAALADYAHEHHDVMGEPFPEMASRVVLKPTAASILGRRAHRWYGAFPCVLTAPIKDYERHLNSIAAVLCGQRVDNTAADPRDALAQAVAGHSDVAASLLLDAAYTAPTYVRGADTYATIHWLYAAAVVLGEIK